MIGWILRRLVRVTWFLLTLPLQLLRLVADRLGRRDLLVLRLRGRVPDLPQQEPFWKRMARRVPRTSLEEALLTLDEAGRDRRVKGALLSLDRCELSLVQAEELLTAIDRLKAQGKKVVVWADGLTGPALMVAAAADRALGVPESQLEFLGIRVRALFLRDALELAGARPELERHGVYKSMADMFERRTMSEPHEEMSRDLGSDLYEQVITPLIVGRGLEREHVIRVLDDAPVANETAATERLIDGVAYRDQLESEAGGLLELGEEPPTAGPGRFLTRLARRERFQEVWRDLPTLRLIELRGTIAPGETSRGCPSRPICRAIDRARRDPGVKAVVLRIDSPGGSAVASDEIWREVRRLDEEKPVVASLGSVAASGGYYIAVGCRKIVAQAASLTGSIGVVSGKLHLGPALERWGVNVDGPSFGARAGLYDPDRAFSPEERAAVRRELMRFYETFLTRVAAGRSMDRDQVDAIAQGRVYTGRRAHGLGLVDQLGGLRTAIAVAAELGEIPRHRLDVATPAQKGMLALLNADAGADAAALLASGLALPRPWGELAELWPLLGREPVLAFCPWQLSGV